MQIDKTATEFGFRCWPPEFCQTANANIGDRAFPPTRCELHQKQPQFRRLSARSLFSAYNRLSPFQYRKICHSHPANYPTLRVHRKVYPSARIVNETRRVQYHCLQADRAGRITWCVLVILTAGCIYTRDRRVVHDQAFTSSPVYNKLKRALAVPDYVIGAIADEAADNVPL